MNGDAEALPDMLRTRDARIERSENMSLFQQPAGQSIRSRPHTPEQRHICIVTESYPPEINGVALTVARLAEGLRLQGYAVSVVRPRQPGFDRRGADDDPEGVLVRGMPLPGYQGLRFGLPAAGLLRRRWKRHRPMVVYIATEGPLGWSASRAARGLSIPAFSGFHTNFHTYAKHYHAGWLHSLITCYLRAFHNRTAGTIVAGSDLRDQLQACGIKNASILGRGVDSGLFHPGRRCSELRRQWGAADRDKVAIYVGRLAPEKNLGLAFRAYRAMRQENNAVKFVVVGDGPEGVTLQRKHADVIFCGLQTGKELARHYALADVFLFPSETETFGNVTLEAMASALVVVAYDYAAAHVHIVHGESGLLIPCGEPRTFIDTAARIAREPPSVFHIRSHARDYAATLDWQRVFERFAVLLLGSSQGEHALTG